jgi:hypothetical protein
MVSVDPAAVMAEHHGGGSKGWDCASCNEGYDVPWPCDPYLMAETLTRVAALLGDLPTPVYDPDNPNCPGSFEGFTSGPRSAHRTVGPHRAWSDAGWARGHERPHPAPRRHRRAVRPRCLHDQAEPRRRRQASSRTTSTSPSTNSSGTPSSNSPGRASPPTSPRSGPTWSSAARAARSTAACCCTTWCPRSSPRTTSATTPRSSPTGPSAAASSTASPSPRRTPTSPRTQPRPRVPRRGQAGQGRPG